MEEPANRIRARRRACRGVAVLIALTFGALAGLMPVAPAYAVPTAPGIVVAQAPLGDQVCVNWDFVRTYSGAVTYYVWRSPDGVNYTKIPGAVIVGLYNCTYVDNGGATPLRSSTRYWYAVSARDSAGEGPRSDTASTRWTYIAPTTKGAVAPRGVEASAAPGAVTLTWDALPAPNTAGYIVYRSTSSGGATTRLNAGLLTSTTYVDATVTNYSHYWYRVSAVSTGAVEGDKSIEVHARPEALVPASVPHGAWIKRGSVSCRICHDLHGAPQENLIAASGTKVSALCFTCHDGTGSQNVVYQDFASTSAGSRHPVAAGANTGTLDCTSCHKPHRSPSSIPKLLSVEGTRTGNGVCYGCHGQGSVLPGGDLRVFQASSHNSSIPGPASGTGVKCSVCHEEHSSPARDLWTYEGYRACFTCHMADQASLGSPDIYTRMTANTDSDTHHDVMARDQTANGTRIACQNCHNSHTVSRANPLIDPDNPSPQGVWTGTYRQFCLRCHDLTLPTAAQTLPYVDPPLDNGALTTNIALAYTTNKHGDGVGTPTLLQAEMGYAAGEVLECNACHEPHGTLNNYNLRSDVRSKNGTVVRQGLMVYKIAEGQYDLRFFCNGCHRVNSTNHPWGGSALNTWPQNCTRGTCHQHSGAKF